MAKKAKISKAQEQANTVAYHALTRAADRIKAEGIGELEPGGYPFKLTASTEGELLVERGTPEGPPKTVCDVSDPEALAGILGSIPEEQRAGIVSNGLGVWKGATDEKRKELKAQAKTLILAAAKRRKLVSEKCSPARRGAVKCKPAVTVGGSVNANDLHLEVDAA